jgi:Cu/Ag efflux pump CusA
MQVAQSQLLHLKGIPGRGQRCERDESTIRARGHSERERAGETAAWLSRCIGVEYQSELRADAQMAIIVPLSALLIFIILYTMYKSFKWALPILATVAMASVGGLLILLITSTNFSVSSEEGFLALFGVSVQSGVILLEYINQLRARGNSVETAAVEGPWCACVPS